MTCPRQKIRRTRNPPDLAIRKSDIEASGRTLRVNYDGRLTVSNAGEDSESREHEGRKHFEIEVEGGQGLVDELDHVLGVDGFSLIDWAWAR